MLSCRSVQCLAHGTSSGPHSWRALRQVQPQERQQQQERVSQLLASVPLVRTTSTTQHGPWGRLAAHPQLAWPACQPVSRDGAEKQGGGGGTWTDQPAAEIAHSYPWQAGLRSNGPAWQARWCFVQPYWMIYFSKVLWSCLTMWQDTSGACCSTDQVLQPLARVVCAAACLLCRRRCREWPGGQSRHCWPDRGSQQAGQQTPATHHNGLRSIPRCRQVFAAHGNAAAGIRNAHA